MHKPNDETQQTTNTRNFHQIFLLKTRNNIQHISNK